MFRNLKYCKVGLALSGGGAKGLVHLGVLKALEDKEIRIDMLSGVSAGSIMAAMYADGLTPEEICEYMSKMDLKKALSLTMPTNGGVTTMTEFGKFVGKKLKAKTFEELKYPLIVNATELDGGHNVYFSSGELLPRLMASASVPLMFTPVMLDGKAYVDGGFFCNLPANILRRNGCDLVIGVHCNPITHQKVHSGFWDVAERVFHLAVNGNTIEEKKSCDILIETDQARDYGMFEADKAKELFAIGYDAAMEALDKFDWDEYMTQRRINKQSDIY